MKKIAWLLVAALLSAMGPVNTEMGQVQASDVSPIVYDIVDASEAQRYEGQGILADQTGDYISIYVYGTNINKDTVKPVFYNEDGEKISGDVKAVETGKQGAFFRIEKKTIPEDEEGWGAFYSIRVDETENEDWKIPLSTESLHKFSRVGYKEFDVKVELEGVLEPFSDQVQIARHEIIYQYYDQRDKTYTVYFAQNADVDTEFAPTLTFQRENQAFVTVENGTFTVAKNTLTKEQEIKATFVLNDEQVEFIKKNSGNDSFSYGVSYKTTDGQNVEFRSDCNYAENCGVEDVQIRGNLNGLYDTIFYLPYWIGGVHTIKANGQESYHLPETDVQVLKEGKYAWAQNGSFGARNYEYYFWKKGEHTGGEATCKDKATCDVCGTPYGGLNPLNHKGETEVRNKLAASCSGLGYTGDVWCKDCDRIVTPGTVIPATGKHSAKTAVTKANASKKSIGFSKSVCSVCGKIIKTNATYYYPKSVTVSTVTYNGKSQTPKVVVKDSKGKTISSSHYSVSKVKDVGESKITITFKSSSAYYTGKLTTKCTVNPPKTTLKSVSAGSKKLTVKWTKKTGGVTGYEVQYSTSKSFKSVKTVTVKKGSTTSTTIEKLKGKKKYYVRVRVLAKVGKTTYKSAWSSAKSKTTKK